MLEHSAAYAAFVNGGKRTTPYSAVEISNRRGDVLYKHDRDAPKQVQAVPLDKVIELGSMMHKVVLEGTGRAADLGPGIDVIGKTGTTNGFKDAWFCGYSGTMGGCIWYGNDDGELMANMTGGSLPAHTWHDVMAYAHQGVQIKPIVGMTPSAPPQTAAQWGVRGQARRSGRAPTPLVAFQGGGRGALRNRRQSQELAARQRREDGGARSGAPRASGGAKFTDRRRRVRMIVSELRPRPGN